MTAVHALLATSRICARAKGGYPRCGHAFAETAAVAFFIHVGCPLPFVSLSDCTAVSAVSIAREPSKGVSVQKRGRKKTRLTFAFVTSFSQYYRRCAPTFKSQL